MGGNCTIDKPQTHTYLMSKSQDHLSRVMTESLRRMIDVDVSVEMVILYGARYNVAFVTLPDGTLAPNGSFGEGYECSDSAVFGCGQSNHEHFLVGLWARVYDRTLARLTSPDKPRMAPLEDHSHAPDEGKCCGR